MISKFKHYNESLLDKMEGLSEKDALKGNPTKVLLHAYETNNLDLFRLALENGANTEKKYSSKQISNATLLHYATYDGKEEIVKLLIEYGALIEKDIYVELLVKHGSIELIKYILDRIKLTYEQYKNILRTALFIDDEKREQLADLINYYIRKNVTKDVSKPWKPYTGVYGQKLDRFVKDYLDNVDESLLTKLEGPSEKEFDEHLSNLKPKDALLKSIKNKYKKGIIDSLDKIDGDLDIDFIDMKKMFEVLEIENNVKEISKIITDIRILYEYSYIFLFKEGLIYCYDKISIKDTFILENIIFDGKNDAEEMNYKRKEEDLIECIKVLIDKGLNIKSVSADDLYTILDDSNSPKLENLFLDYMSNEQVGRMLEIVSNEESTHQSLFVKLLKSNPPQESKDEALKNMCQYVEDVAHHNVYFFVSKLLEADAKASDKILKKASTLKDGSKDDMKVYNLFKKYFDI